MKNLIKNKAFTMFELLIVISIISLIVAILLPSLSIFRDSQTLKNTTEDIVTLLNQARSQTLASQNSHYYSVHFEAGRAVLFTDGVFSEPNSSNVEITFDNKVSIPAIGGINLNGGVSDVNFTRLTGDTVDYGTIVVQLNSNNTKTKTITIRKTGIVSSN
jgi:prepilin-type N-terminal cleavage/methylation domain-containing protein